MKAIKELLHRAEIENPELYYRAKHELHEMEYGPNYNEKLALHDVSCFESTDTNGVKRKGEHWTLAQVKNVYELHKLKLTKANANVYDLYVALHVWWHDLSCNYKRRNQSNYENDIIEDAITFFFCDEDGKESKIWYYVMAMM